MKRFELKPPVVDAIQFTPETLNEILQWFVQTGYKDFELIPAEPSSPMCISLPSRNVHLGDYIVRYKGEFSVKVAEEIADLYTEILPVKEVGNG